MSTDLVVIPQAVQEELDSVQSACAVALDIRIVDVVTERAATEASRRLNTEAKNITAHRLSITRPMDEAKKRVMEIFAGPLRMLEEAEKTVDRKIMAYRQEQARIREEAERKLREQAERERLEAERKAAELRAKAEAAETAGRSTYLEQLAEQQEEKAVSITPPTLPPVQKMEGVGVRDNWSAEVTDLMALVQGVAAGTVPLTALDANMTVLNQMARALKSGLNYPGVRAVNNPSLSKRAA